MRLPSGCVDLKSERCCVAGGCWCWSRFSTLMGTDGRPKPWAFVVCVWLLNVLPVAVSCAGVVDRGRRGRLLSPVNSHLLMRNRIGLVLSVVCLFAPRCVARLVQSLWASCPCRRRISVTGACSWLDWHTPFGSSPRTWRLAMNYCMRGAFLPPPSNQSKRPTERENVGILLLRGSAELEELLQPGERVYGNRSLGFIIKCLFKPRGSRGGVGLTVCWIFAM